MICAKNYETVSKGVKVMPKILWPLFSGHGVHVRIDYTGICSRVLDAELRRKSHD